MIAADCGGGVEDSAEWNLRALDEAGTHVMGRRSYEIRGPHWLASEGPIATYIEREAQGGLLQRFGERGLGLGVFGDPGAAIADLNARDDDGTILIHGGPTFASSVVRLGLVDEYQVAWVPIAIGTGLSPFADLDRHLKLDVVQEQRFASGALGQVLVPKP
jgi:dihydrofolate reductase